jgi:hypothetical protein
MDEVVGTMWKANAPMLLTRAPNGCWKIVRLCCARFSLNRYTRTRKKNSRKRPQRTQNRGKELKLSNSPGGLRLIGYHILRSLRSFAAIFSDLLKKHIYRSASEVPVRETCLRGLSLASSKAAKDFLMSVAKDDPDPVMRRVGVRGVSGPMGKRILMRVGGLNQNRFFFKNKRTMIGGRIRMISTTWRLVSSPTVQMKWPCNRKLIF